MVVTRSHFCSRSRTLCGSLRLDMVGIVFALGFLPLCFAGFTDADVAKLGAALAGAVLADYTQVAAPRSQLITFTDESGWLVQAQDLIDHAHILMPIVKMVPDRIPGIMYLALSILAACGILSGRICNGETSEAWKYAGKLRCCIQHLRYLRRSSATSK